MQTPNSDESPVASTPFRPWALPERRPFFLALGTPIWMGILAVVCAGLLLFAFQQVVHNVVKEAEARGQAVMEQGQALLRCNQKVGAKQQDNCRTQLAALRLDNTTTGQTPDGVEAATVSLASN